MKTLKAICFTLGILFTTCLYAEITGNEKALITEIKSNFGIPGMTTSWYGDIKSISSDSGKLIIKTNTNDASKLNTICSAVSALYSDSVGWNKLYVETVAKNNSSIKRNGIEKCK